MQRRPAPIDRDETRLNLTEVKDGPDYDHDETVRRAYRQKCRLLGVVPTGVFLRQCSGETLNLRNHPLGPRGAQALATPLTMTTTLTSIDLTGCDMQASGLRYIAQALVQNNYITDVSLAQNNLAVKSAELICQLMEYNTAITSLNLAGNHLGDKAGEPLAALLMNHSLLELDLSGNDLGVETALLLGSAIGVNDTLTRLDLSWNQIRLQGALAIARGIKENVRLHTLSLAYNGFDHAAAEALGKALQNNDSLLELDMTSTRLTDTAVVMLTNGLHKNEVLRKLTLSNNPFTHIGAYGSLQAIKKNDHTSMKRLELKGISPSAAFLELLDAIHVTSPAFVAVFDPIPQRKSAKEVLELFFKQLLNEDKTPVDVFHIADEDAEKLLTQEEFLQKLKEADIKLDSHEKHTLAELFDHQDRGLPNIGQLYAKWHEQTKCTR